MEETVARWVERFLVTESLDTKRRPGPPPESWQGIEAVPAPSRPGRPAELASIDKTRRSLKASQLQNPRRRAQLLHSFWHHELQAAELMCWAILRFPETPLVFRRGLLGVCLDEIRHMGLYERHIRSLGYAIGDFPVRDWFWQRVARCETPMQFVALLGIGFEGGNLDHSRTFAARFREVGDVAGAELQEQVGDEEVGHVRFAWRWFREWSGATDDEVFECWRTSLVDPLTPSMMRGRELDLERRRQAGMTDGFLGSLRAWDAPPA